jgi:hypothetical protein
MRREGLKDWIEEGRGSVGGRCVNTRIRSGLDMEFRNRGWLMDGIRSSQDGQKLRIFLASRLAF